MEFSLPKDKKPEMDTDSIAELVCKGVDAVTTCIDEESRTFLAGPCDSNTDMEKVKKHLRGAGFTIQN